MCFSLAFALLVIFVLQERHSARAMFDLSLFRNHTFDGGAIAAFGLSASLFALLLYVVLYLQDGEGHSALGTGLRLLVISAGLMVAATVSGRLTQRVPVRLLIGGGLVLVGAGLLLMARLGPSSTWTVLVPGFVVAGVGAGMVNPPLASTAVGVVEPRRAGMASGINSTFRQVGISTGVAALGSIFGSEVSRELRRDLGSVRGLAAQVPTLSKAIQGGESSQFLAHVPAAERARLVHATLALVHARPRRGAVHRRRAGARFSGGRVRPHQDQGLRGQQPAQPRPRPAGRRRSRRHGRARPRLRARPAQ